MTMEDQYTFRIACALKMTNMFRAALEANGNLYHGGLSPNITSISDVLHMPFDMLVHQVNMRSAVGFDGVRHDIPEWGPTPEELAQVKALLAK